jgi:hypothetical protein
MVHPDYRPKRPANQFVARYLEKIKENHKFLSY